MTDFESLPYFRTWSENYWTAFFSVQLLITDRCGSLLLKRKGESMGQVPLNICFRTCFLLRSGKGQSMMKIVIKTVEEPQRL